MQWEIAGLQDFTRDPTSACDPIYRDLMAEIDYADVRLMGENSS